MLFYPQNTEIFGCKLVLTCSACPEQYDVFYFGEQIGYLRLRHGNFSADYPDVGGRQVYAAHPQGDGMFEPQERLYQLTKAVQALLAERLGTTYNITVAPGITMDLSHSELMALKNQIDRLFEPR